MIDPDGPLWRLARLALALVLLLTAIPALLLTACGVIWLPISLANIAQGGVLPVLGSAVSAVAGAWLLRVLYRAWERR